MLRTIQKFHREYNLVSTLLWTSPICCFFYVFIPHYLIPTEDAAILYSYAENWVQTGNISYFPGGPATEGSTDFLFLLLVSFGVLIGFKVYTSALIVNAITTVISVYYFSKIIKQQSLLSSLIAITVIFGSTQIGAGIYGYGTMAFGAAIIFTLYKAYQNEIRACFIGAFITVLFRPDGIVIMAPLIIFILLKDLGDLRSNLILLLKFCILPGLFYFLWRYWYFDTLLPLPFYVKTEGEKWYGIFLQPSFYFNRHYILYIITPWFLGLISFIIFHWRKISAIDFAIMICTIIIPLIFYSTTQQDMNLGNRYQYPVYLGISILLFKWIFQHKAYFWMIFCVIGMFNLNQNKKLFPNTKYSNLYLTAKDLGQFYGKLAVTDAGYMAWKTKWEVIDMWGLNTLEYAQKVITPQDLLIFQPDIIEIPVVDIWSYPKEQTIKSITNVGLNAYKFALDNDYEIWQMPRGLIEQKDKTLFHPWIDRILCFSPYVDHQITFCIRKDYPYYPQIIEIMKKRKALHIDFKSPSL